MKAVSPAIMKELFQPVSGHAILQAVVIDSFAHKGFPNYIGTINGTHFPIICHLCQALELIIRGYFSIVLEDPVNHYSRFININKVHLKRFVANNFKIFYVFF